MLDVPIDYYNVPVVLLAARSYIHTMYPGIVMCTSILPRRLLRVCLSVCLSGRGDRQNSYYQHILLRGVGR